ncbi:hypothetical protein Acr_23g0014560 [Actinidia rufa]|uniref:Uncharacterized protein n=1 Tax=Actinidia rufa TaxID=165716 RepID=A0A7J0GQL3_9ERIC|nr:hypothetical protein Acr_23g0014560 [Actinidia rufa]
MSPCRFARFLPTLSSLFDGAHSQIFGANELPPLSEVFSRLRQASLPPVAQPIPSTLPWLHLWGLIVLLRVVLVVMGMITPVLIVVLAFGGCDSSSSGRSREHGPRRCTHCNQENHTVDRCWDLHGRLDGHPVCSSGFPQTGASAACLATHIPWVIDSGVSNYITDTTSVLSSVSTYAHLSRLTLADGYASHIDGLGTTSLSSSLS